MTVDQVLRKAKTLVMQGKVGEAAELYRMVLQAEPLNAAALAGMNALGARALSQGNGPATSEPGQDRLQVIISLHDAGKFAEAFNIATGLARDFPRSPVLANISGVLALKMRRQDEAIVHFQRAAELKPDFAEVHANLGNLYRELGHSRKAEQSYRAALSYKPNEALILSGLGNVLVTLNRLDEALVCFQDAIERAPNDPEIYNSLGNLYHQTADWDAAVVCYRRAVEINPRYAPAYNNLGSVERNLGRLETASFYFLEAVRLDPEFAQAFSNLGALRQAQGKAGEAMAYMKKAVEMRPDLSAPHASLGNLYGALGEAELAFSSYRKALEIAPNDLPVLASARHQQAMMCQWDDFTTASYSQLLNADIKETGGPILPPFVIVTHFDDPALQLKAAAGWTKNLTKGITPAMITPDGKTDRRIRIGYYSPDLRDHPLTQLMIGMLETIDKSRFELHAFSFSPEDIESPMRDRVRRTVEGFYDVREQAPDAIASRSREIGIDIAVDLAGFTGSSRPAIFAHRAGGVQVGYLGYPGTSGSPHWDYFIADRMLVPPGSEGYFSEKLVFMPDSYQANDNGKIISQTLMTRAECGLPETGFVFCCFNNSYKITPVEFDIWMRLLRAVPGSVLWLLKGDEHVVGNLSREASLRGVDPTRLVFAERMKTEEHLARHRLADLFLDTFVCNAHTTTSDALWAGLPVLTRPGNSFCARVAGSLVTAANLPELAVQSVEDYEAMALDLALSPARLARLRERLAGDHSRLPLFDTERYTRNMERAYEAMFAIYQSGEKPRHITV